MSLSEIKELTYLNFSSSFFTPSPQVSRQGDMLLPSTRRAASNEFRLVLNCGVRTQSIASRLPSSSINGVYQRSAICYPSSLSTKSRMNFSTTPLTRQEEQQEEEKEMDDGEKNIHDILTRTFEPKMLKVSDVSGTYYTHDNFGCY